MIVQGVFSMSFLNRLRSIFGAEEKEEKNSPSLNTIKVEEAVKVTSSKKKLNDNIVSGIKTSEPISKDMSSNKNKLENTNNKKISIPELEKEATIIAQEKVNEVAEKEEKAMSKGSDLIDNENVSEEVETGENNKTEDENTKNNEKRDNMTLLTDKELITSESLDKDFTAAFIDAGIETVKNCFQCGTCGGTCPSGRRTPYKVRQLVRKCLLGLKEDVISDDALWMCTTCYTCQERCPRSVTIVNIVKKARNIAAHAGYMAKPHKMTGLFVITTGHGVPINPVTKELRERVGLGPLPPTTHMFPEALEEVQKICKITGFDELIGYDEATGELKD